MDHAHEHGGHHPIPRPLSRLWPLLKPERNDLTLIVLYAVGVGFLSLATPIAIEALVNTVANVNLIEPVIILSLIMFGCLILAAALIAMQGFVIECMQQRMFVRVVSDFAHRLPRVRMDAYDHQHGPELVNRFFDVLNVMKAMATLLLDVVGIAVSTVIGIIVLALYGVELFGFGMGLLIALCFMLFILGRRGITTGIAESHHKYEVAAWLEELARVPRCFKFTRGPNLAIAESNRLTQEYIRTRKVHFRVVYRQFVFALFLQALASSILLGIGGYLVVNQRLTLGQLVAAELIVSLIVGSFAKMGKYIESYYDLCVGIEKLGLITDLPLEAEHGEALPLGKGGMSITVMEVETEHAGHGLSHVSWSADPGERLALVGPSGVGKSRLLDLLSGLSSPTDGYIKVDGIDLRHLSLLELRQQVAIVQGADIVTGTIADNLKLSREGITTFDMREALERAGLLPVLADLPKGLDTPLIPSGRPLSTGESIRLCIARAMLVQPRLLILDGVLDLIDFAPCPHLLDHLFDRNAPWTLLVATHRQDVMERCDRVVRLESFK